MKKLISLCAALSLCSIVPAEFEVPHLSVYGTAETKVTPDELNWNVSVRSTGKDVQALASQHLDEVDAVLRFLEQNNVPEKDIQTTRMQLGENWEYRNQSRLKTGYFAHTQVAFKTTDFDAYVTLWTELARLPNLTINGVGFGISNYMEIQKETRIKAVKAAKRKAEELAGVLGAGLAEPLLLEEITPGMDSSAGMARNEIMMQAAPPADARGGISPGQESITMQVRVIYRITGG